MDPGKIPENRFNSVYKHVGQFYSISDNAAKSYIFSKAVNKAHRIKYENLKAINPDSQRLESFYVWDKKDTSIKVLDPRDYSIESTEGKPALMITKLGKRQNRDRRD